MHTTTNLLHKSTVRVVHCSVHNGQPPGFPLHSHPTWEITVHCQGKIRTVQGNTAIETFPGTVFLHAPGQPHGDIASEPYQLIYIMFECDPPKAFEPVLYDDPDGSLQETCKAIIREWRGQACQFETMTDLLIRRLVLLIERLTSALPHTESEQLVAAAAAIIEDRFNLPLTLEELCKELSTTTTKLRRDFVHARGQTPTDYLQAVRLRHAIGTLRSTDLTLETVAHLSGYNSASHLTRHIKAATGSTPGQLRRTHELLSAL
jgi:AraC-like DNA-binding protein